MLKEKVNYLFRLPLEKLQKLSCEEMIKEYSAKRNEGKKVLGLTGK